MRRKRGHWWRVALVGTVAAVVTLGASAVPVFGADNGTVNATVTVPAPAAACITVSGPVSFGTASFQPIGSSTLTDGSPTISIDNCGTASESIFARGTNAINDGTSGPPVGAITWTLTSTPQCGTGGVVNHYNLGLADPGVAFLPLTSSDVSIGSLGGSATLLQNPRMRMPCQGSSGAGETMAMSYVFTATL